MPDLISPTPGAPVNFPYAEKIALQKIGLSEEAMRQLRTAKLRLDVDFVYHKKSVYLSASALEKIAPELGPLISTAPPPASASAQISPIPSAVQKLLVVRATQNKHILMACPSDQDPDRPKTTVRVRVKTTEGFRIRTTIEARLVTGYEDLFDLVSKYPRKKTNL